MSDRIRPMFTLTAWVALPAALLVALVLMFLPTSVAVAQDDDGANVDGSFALVMWQGWADEYTDWSYEAGVPADYYVGVEPHGMILRTFVNDIAADDVSGGATVFSPGAVLIKENHAPTGVDISDMEAQTAVPGFEGDLQAWTYMVKMPGYAPETGDWFYGRIAGDGSLMAAGSPAGCVGCHSQVEDNDWVFNAPLGN